jgi:hypothetical protein
MPNGDGETYNPAWCREKHDRIDHQIESIWEKFRRQDTLMWGIMLALVANLGGIVATLLKVGS